MKWRDDGGCPIAAGAECSVAGSGRLLLLLVVRI
jgi:hypothetical protein